jgi:hypothetical protein
MPLWTVAAWHMSWSDARKAGAATGSRFFPDTLLMICTVFDTSFYLIPFPRPRC